MAQFVKGQSGNPGGRPKEAEGLAAMIRAQSKDGKDFVERLLDFVKSAREQRDRLTALKILLEYGFGKPKQQVELSGDTQITIIVETGVPQPEKPSNGPSS